MKKICLIGAFDTKGPEYAFVREQILARDRELSDKLFSAGLEHYSLRYTEVTAVHSGYLRDEPEHYRDQAAKAWKESLKSPGGD